ncbi:glycosyltransferase family 4 protein [Dolichospermum sp. ST_con]|nr:glycosyltransferase family 4 protein [Dolichospermum sp. ST_con]MDD1419746.1 glycosyltransferase family 4 protein [Dolichospermum sp. ST_sed1]MDD1428596.1 glycosyltransferase family 4 protein [Dolichospermum sp. ST_sed9]MDD1432744.1 glycosyltransferase family 4 protein [Dolichospermum sp. ST_sed6]MDD1443976.1 glycosyltransferase family 4 protein [Dolichospermum sp. ST_sed3]MDD1457705.1 glycosyltransferase family 4 protein [Dolichospermum sp. ST_sed7]MDD1463475.1 glycosyltransferase family 
MEGKDIKLNSASASILTLGTGWFPKNPGGLERYIYELTHKLAVAQDQVELCGVGLPVDTENTRIKLTNLADPDSKISSRLWSIRDNFKKTRLGKPDAINLHFALYSFPILDILPKGIPVTFNFHGPWASESQEEVVNKKFSVWLKEKLIEQSTYNRCDRFIVLSKAFGQILHQKYQIPWQKIHIIPGGVDIDHFQNNLSRQEARIKLGWPTNRPILFTSRRLVHRMGIDKLLQAIAIIKTEIPDIWLAIAGRGHIQALLQQQARELGLENNVQFLGFLPENDLPVAYQAADLTVMPSQSFEGFGLAILESLACGTPVLCTPVGGMPEILQKFSPDLITETITVESIADKLAQVMLGKLSLPSREECRNYTIKNYDWTNITQQVRQVLLT